MARSNSAQQEVQEDTDFSCEECGLNCAEWESEEDFKFWKEFKQCAKCAETDRKEYEREIRLSLFR